MSMANPTASRDRRTVRPHRQSSEKTSQRKLRIHVCRHCNGRPPLMPKRGAPPLQGELIQGTLDMLILQTLVLGPAHGHTIAYAIEHRSDEVLQIEHGSLYPALHRLEDRGWISSF